MSRVLLAKDLESELNAFSSEVDSAVQVFQVTKANLPLLLLTPLTAQCRNVKVGTTSG